MGTDMGAVGLGIEEKDKANAPVAGAGRMERCKSGSGYGGGRPGMRSWAMRQSKWRARGV